MQFNLPDAVAIREQLGRTTGAELQWTALQQRRRWPLLPGRSAAVAATQLPSSTGTSRACRSIRIVMNGAPTLGLPRWPAADQALVDVLGLFPRSILRGTLPDPLLQQLTALSESVLAHPESSPDASAKLAGQLRQQRELRPDQPGVQELSNNHLLPACDRWIRHVMDRQPPQGRGPWVPGRTACR